METICLKCLEKQPPRRYASAGELADDLERFLAGRPISARPVGLPERALKWARRKPAVALLLALLALSVFGGLAGVTWKWLEADEQRQRADAQARQADVEKRAALRQAYRARLAAVSAAIAGHDVADAARQLDEAPEALRGWEWQHLHSRLDDSSAMIPTPAASQPFLLHGPEGLRLASVLSTRVSLTDEDGRECLTLPLNPLRSCCALGQTRRGLWIVYRGEDKKVLLLDEAGNVRMTADDPTERYTGAAAVSPDSARLALAWAKDIALYEVASGKEQARCVGHTDQIFALAFSPDGTQIASASEDRTARLWHAATGAPRAEFRGHTSKVHSVAFRPDGSRVLTASADGSVRQRDTQTGREVEPPYERHTGEVLAAVYSPDGQWVASGGTDRTVRLWRATGRQEVALLHGHTGDVTELAFTPDGRRLASGSPDGTVRIWEADPHVSLPVLRGHGSYVYPVAYSPDGGWIASGSWDNTVRVWDAQTGEPVVKLPHPGVVETLAFSRDSSRLFTGCQQDDRIRVWDVATGQRQAEFQGPGPMRALAISPDGTGIAALDGKGNLSLLEADTGREVARDALGEAGPRWPLAWSPDGRWLAVPCAGPCFGLWDTRSHQLSAQFPGHDGAIHSVAFSTDGKRLVSAGLDRTVRVWEAETGACQVLRGHTDEVFTAVFHPDGRRIASAGRDATIWLWDTATGEEVVRLPGHTNYVWSLAFSPDGKTLVSGSGDGTVRLWDTEPLAKRHRARREAEALRPEAERIVRRLFAEWGEPAQVVTRLRADASLNHPLRRAALRAVMGREEQARP
jgi:WD40 repeat protein